MFGKILSYIIEKQNIIITFEEKIGIVEILTPSIIRLREEQVSSFSVDPSSISGEVKFETKLENGILTIATPVYTYKIKENFKLEILRENLVISDEVDTLQRENHNFNLEILEKEGHKADRQEKEHAVMINKVVKSSDTFYGLGDKAGFLNKRGYEYEMWNTDDPSPHCDHYKSLYKSIPFFTVMNENYVYGFFFDNTYKQYYDMAKTNQEIVQIAFDQGYFNYYFIGGNTLKEVVSNYTLITGRTPLPQRFTLGYQQCRWSYMNREEFMDVAKKMRAYHIPCDTLFLDIDYMDHYKVFTTSEEHFPHFKEMVDELKTLGFKIVTIIDPGVKVEDHYQVYEEGKANHYFATKDNAIYVNEVWPGDAVYPSFINKEVRSWWGDNLKFLVDLGIDGIWNDMNEPASFKGPLPDDVVFRGDNQDYLHQEIHNVYGHYMAEATYEGLKRLTNKRPYIITRACYAGTQKYSTAWTGDNHSLWAHLQLAIPQVINLGISGMAFSGTDVGGFCADTTKELLIRWSQLGAFTPLFRNHSAMGTRHQEPWSFDEETLNIYRKSVEIRYRIIPYIYDLYYECAKNGLPLFRGLVMNYPDDPNTKELNDEFMLGDNLLIAPVVEPGARHKLVYLPKGRWYSKNENKWYESGYHVVDAPLDTVPFFVKENSIIATRNVSQYLEEDQEITWEIYGREASYLHYQDDGESFDYQRGKYNLYSIVFKDGKASVTLLHKGYPTYQKIHLKYQGKLFEISAFNQDYFLK